MSRGAVTPTFQSARLAGWKTGVTKLHGFMAPRRDFEILEALHEPWLRTAAVSEGPAAWSLDILRPLTLQLGLSFPSTLSHTLSSTWSLGV